MDSLPVKLFAEQLMGMREYFYLIEEQNLVNFWGLTTGVYEYQMEWNAKDILNPDFVKVNGMIWLWFCTH